MDEHDERLPEREMENGETLPGPPIPAASTSNRETLPSAPEANLAVDDQAGAPFDEQEADTVAEEEPFADNQALLDDNLDIEAALASVATLDDALAEHAAAEAAEAERLAAEATALEEAERLAREEAEQRAAFQLPRPPVISALQRGQAASAIPALLLMAIGAWLTFALSTDSPPSLGQIVIVGMGSVGISLLAYWFTSGRWMGGALFWGMTSLLWAAALFYVTQGDTLAMTEGWPLLVVAVAVAFLLSALFAPPVGDSHIFAGILLSVAGLTALAVTTGKISDEVMDIFSTAAPAVLVVVAVVLIFPQIPKRPD